MTNKFDPQQNYEKTRAEVGYIDRSVATPELYPKIGFKCGLEIHQQLKTDKKLFCRCPVGIYQEADDYDAEILRHMRPTLSEMGEYDGTALMERKTKKNITYRLKGKNACTYELDDTPPFAINRDALNIAIEIGLLLKSNIVGELHITRKQYLDGSIPAGFQRTAIVGVEGEIKLRNKTVRMIQLSIEEDSCREVSDIGHERIYRTDRLGIPLIEMVTYPELLTPDEAKDGCEYLRYLARSSGKVRTGIGAARQDVNVSVTGGTRIEIKGVAHSKWIPELSHNEAFRQIALLKIAKRLADKKLDSKSWQGKSRLLDQVEIDSLASEISSLGSSSEQVAIITLPGFHTLLSHFTQPGKRFADEFSDRLKVVACLEKPNMIHTEQLAPLIAPERLRQLAEAKAEDAVILVAGNIADVTEAISTIDERARMAFDGIPDETRKSFADGTTIFERVLPGPDRMYPDTDSAPLGVDDDLIESIRSQMPRDVSISRDLLDSWQVASDAQHYLQVNNLVTMLEQYVEKQKVSPRWLCHIFGHRVRHLEGRHSGSVCLRPKVLELISFLADKKIKLELIKRLLPLMYKLQDANFDDLLGKVGYQAIALKEIFRACDATKADFSRKPRSDENLAYYRWRMGELAVAALGNVNMSELASQVSEEVQNG